MILKKMKLSTNDDISLEQAIEEKIREFRLDGIELNFFYVSAPQIVDKEKNQFNYMAGFEVIYNF